MARPVIAFLSDFGTTDHYAGVMKGVALGICPDAVLVDISHGIAPQDVLGGALELAASYRYFPPATIFVVVVDPGVGSARRAIAMEAGGYRFVGPDNGVLSLVCDEAPPQRVVELTNAAYALPVVSRTFEGRDRFAPAAAWLASGVDLGALGPVVTTWQTVAIPPATVSEHAISGEVIRVDRFGNLITNIDRPLVDRLAAAAPVTVTIGATQVGPIAETYAAAAPGTLCALFGSSGRLEIAVTGGDAAARLAAGTGTSVGVHAEERRERGEREERADRSDRSERSGRSDRAEAEDRSDRSDRSGRSNRSDGAERAEGAERERSERSDRSTGSSRSDGESPDRADRSDDSDGSDR